jgi:hypothetical protein
VRGVGYRATPEADPAGVAESEVES